MLVFIKVPGAVVLTEAQVQIQRARDAAPKMQKGVVHYTEESILSDGKWLQRGSVCSLVALLPECRDLEELTF